MYVFIFLVKVTEWPPIGKIAAHSAYDMFHGIKYLIVSLVFSHLGFWSGNLFLIAPFPDLCLLVPFFFKDYKYSGISKTYITSFFRFLLLSTSNARISEGTFCRVEVQIYLVFTEKKKKKKKKKKKQFPFYFIQYTSNFQFTRQAVKIQKPKSFETTNNFGTTLFLTF